MAYQTTQPDVTPQMQAGGNKNASNKPFNSAGQREWSNGLCDCFGDCGTCCLATFCLCFVYSQNKTRLEHLDQQGYPHPSGGDLFNSDCCLFYVVASCGFGWILQMSQREKIRRRYRIEGSGFGDCCTSYWCAPCELTQESREIELEEKSMNPKA